MAFSHARYTDARQSTFNDVGRDHITVNQIHINFTLFNRPQQRPNHHPFGFSDDVPRSTSRTGASSPGRLLITPYNSSHATSVLDTAVDLIVRITDILIDRTDSSNNPPDFALELESFFQTLTLTGLAIQGYRERPLGQSLANTITPELNRCCTVLQELLDRIDGTWLGLNLTSIGDLWRQVWWGRWDGDELAPLRKRLSDSWLSLEGFLIALHSVAWMELGNGLCADPASLRKFYDVFGQRLPFLGHIKLNAVDVVSHLGETIPVPNMFCYTWKDFDYVIQGHCRDRFGSHLIKRGDYGLIRAEDSQIIGPSELASTAQSGIKLEMCVILRKTTAHQRRCPRCSQINSKVVSDSGWIECYKCSGYFQIAEAGLNYGVEGNNAQGDNKEHNGLVDEERWRNNTESGDEELISPASRTREGVTGETSASGTQRRRDDDDIRFFRRIRVICMNYGNSTLGAIELDQNPDSIMGPPDLDRVVTSLASAVRDAMTTLYDLQTAVANEVSGGNGPGTLLDQLQKSRGVFRADWEEYILFLQRCRGYTDDYIDLCEYSSSHSPLQSAVPSMELLGAARKLLTDAQILRNKHEVDFAELLQHKSSLVFLFRRSSTPMIKDRAQLQNGEKSRSRSARPTLHQLVFVAEASLRPDGLQVLRGAETALNALHTSLRDLTAVWEGQIDHLSVVISKPEDALPTPQELRNLTEKWRRYRRGIQAAVASISTSSDAMVVDAVEVQNDSPVSSTSRFSGHVLPSHGLTKDEQLS